MRRKLFQVSQVSNLHQIFIILFIFIIILPGCEQYIGYDYSAGSIGNLIEIRGLVSDIFDGDPVLSARIDFGGQITFSDTSGHYKIEYVLGVDEQRDKPVILTIAAENYMPFEREFILYPVDTVINIRMEYGAPIIDKIWIGFYESLIIFQTRIRDYQTVDNLQRVVSEMHYFKNGEPDSRVLEQLMTQISVVDSNVAIYQSNGPLSLGDGWFFELRKFLIKVYDSDGFMDEVDQINDDNWSPDTLFTPIPVL